MTFDDKIDSLSLDYLSKLNEILSEKLNICIGRKFISDDTVKFYGFTYKNSDDNFSFAEAKTRIMASEEAKHAIYNLWMDMYH